MATAPETGRGLSSQSNGRAEIERLENLVRELEDECVRLRLLLRSTEKQRDEFLKELYEQARLSREFEDVDIPSLEAMSAGPVELIE